MREGNYESDYIEEVSSVEVLGVSIVKIKKTRVW